MIIVERYIIKSIIVIFLTTILIFCFLFILIDSATNLDEFIDREVPFDIIIQYYLSYLPFIIVQTASMACLISALLIFSNLNSHNEIIALRSSGLGFWQITKPALCFGLMVSACVFIINERYVPQADSNVRKIKQENLTLKGDRTRKKKGKIKDLTFYGLKNRLYYVDSFDQDTYELNGITIIEFDNNQNIKEKLVALKGVWTGIGAWKFFTCHITTFSQILSEPTKIKVYNEKLIDIKETPEDFIKQRLNVKSMNSVQLFEYIQRFTNSGAKRALNNLRVDFHHKISFPLRNFVILLVGLPLCLMTGRRKAQTFTALGLAIAIGFLYYVTEALGLALGKGGLLPPILSAWLAPGLFTGISLYIIKTKF